MRMGRVRVDGEVCRELGTDVDPEEETVEVDGEVVELPRQFTYLALHKPVGVVTTLEDPQGRTTVADLLPDGAPRLWPVGRLDMDSSGLLLMTDDGRLTHRLTHPSYEARKRYRVRFSNALDPSDVDHLRDGVELDDGYRTEPAEIEILDRDADSTTVIVTLTEGKNRQIRRMGTAVGHEVLELQRVAVGPVELDDLAEGQSRPLEDGEIRALYAEVDEEPHPRALD